MVGKDSKVSANDHEFKDREQNHFSVDRIIQFGGMVDEYLFSY